MTTIEKVQTLMKRDGLKSRYALAKALELEPTVVNNWFYSNSIPLKWLLVIGKHFDVSLQVLIDENFEIKW